MPVVYVFGLPSELTSDDIEKLYRELDATLTSIKECLRSGEAVFFFPPDRMALDLGKEIVVRVEGLNITEPEVPIRDGVAAKLGEVVKVRFPEALVMVYVIPYDFQWGRWSSASKT